MHSLPSTAAATHSGDGAQRHIAVFDTGIAGTILLDRLKTSVACARWLNVADNGGFPYGDRSAAEVAQRLVQTMRGLESLGVTDVILACATASTVWLQAHLEEEFPRLRVHDMVEPAARAAAWLAVEKIGIAGTPLALRTGIHRQVIHSYITHRPTTYLPLVLPSAASLVEAGTTGETALREIVATAAGEFCRGGGQALVLSSAHYTLRSDLWERYLPPGTIIVDAVAELVRTLQLRWGRRALEQPAPVYHFASADRHDFAAQAVRFGSHPIRVELFPALARAA